MKPSKAQAELLEKLRAGVSQLANETQCHGLASRTQLNQLANQTLELIDIMSNEKAKEAGGIDNGPEDGGESPSGNQPPTDEKKGEPSPEAPPA